MVKRPGHEVAHSPPSAVKIENDNYICNTPYMRTWFGWKKTLPFITYFFPLSKIVSEKVGIHAAEERESKKEKESDVSRGSGVVG